MSEDKELEIERLKRALSEEKVKTSILSEYSRFGLWEYHIADDLFFQYKPLFGKINGTNDPISHFRDTVISNGSVFSEDLPGFSSFCSAMEHGEDKVSCEIRVVNEESDTVRIKFEGKLVRDENGLPIKYIGRVLDITGEESAAEQRSEKLDTLTEAYNLNAFRELIEEKRKGANRYSSAGLLAVGIDDFRGILAKSGSEYTDYLQKTVAKILLGISVCERDCFIARVRDGEFLIFSTFEEQSFLDNLAKRVIVSVKNYIFDGNTCTVSVGLSTFKNARLLEDVYAEAMSALGEARRSGGRCYMSYSPAMSMSAYQHLSEVSSAPDLYSNVSGSSKVYALVLQAFCSKSEKDRMLYMKEAFKTAGELLGASNIFVYSDDNGRFFRNLTYNATGNPLESCPMLKIDLSESDMKSLLFNKPKLRIHSGGEKINGVALVNGAICAECRAIKYEGLVCEFFAVIFNSSFELNAQDIQIIDALENALTKMYGEYRNNTNELASKRLQRTIINDHRIEGFSIVPGEYRVELVQDAAHEHYGLEPGDICYKKIYGRDKPCDNCPVKKLDKGELFASSAQYVPEERRWLDIAASIDTNTNGEPRYHISSTDITDCLGKVNMSDTLTGLMTFNVFSAEALRVTSEEKGVHRFVTVINIADFRRLNEEKGYETGNSILIAVSEILKESVSAGELLCRSEGSRFFMLLTNDSAEEFTDRLTLIMQNIQKQVLRKLRLTIYLVAGAYDMYSDTVGVMGGVDRAIRAQKTIRDRAYYHENLIAFFDEALREKIKERRYIEANMFTALENNEFQVFYQPKISIETGKVVGAEALARWIRPDGEVISPSKFVPIFEENGFITDMDFAVYRRSIADIRRWLRIGIDVPLISLNVSRHHLGDDTFCEKLNALIDSIGVPHKYIELEITESLLTDHIEKLIETVTWFKERGYRISVDDFGSGYSSLNLITMLPFDTLKIDGGFFLKNDLTEKNRKVITSVVTLAKSLNLETVSEGVETQTQVDFLKELGCDMIQGFFYYKPMCCEQFEEILKNQTPSLANTQ